MRALPLLALLALGACSLNPFAGPRAAPDTPEQAECRREARNDESVRSLFRTLSPGNNDRIIQEDINRATERAFRNCLRVRGLPGAGGVEVPPPR
jgi:hypothetical protein